LEVEKKLRKSFVIGLVLFVIVILVQVMLPYLGIDIATRATILVIFLVVIGVIVELFRPELPGHRRVVEIGIYLLLVGILVLLSYTLYVVYVDFELIWGFTFVALPCGVVFLAGLLLIFYGIHLKDKAGLLNW
jgi:hypothetical protein